MIHVCVLKWCFPLSRALLDVQLPAALATTVAAAAVERDKKIAEAKAAAAARAAEEEEQAQAQKAAKAQATAAGGGTAAPPAAHDTRVAYHLARFRVRDWCCGRCAEKQKQKQKQRVVGVFGKGGFAGTVTGDVVVPARACVQGFGVHCVALCDKHCVGRC
jgi:hypothetical protein